MILFTRRIWGFRLIDVMAFGLLIALIILFAAKPPESPELLTSVTFPVFKQLFLDMGWFYLAFGAFVIVGAANAVNFTDGLDGHLCQWLFHQQRCVHHTLRRCTGVGQW